MSDAPAAPATAAPATDAPAGAPAVTPAPAPPAAPAAKADAKADAKAPDAKPWVNPHVARRAAPKAPAAPVAAAPAAPAAPPVDPAKRLAEVEALHKAEGEKSARYRSVIEAHAATELAALPDRVRESITRRAKGDPVAALDLIATAREMGLTSTTIPTGATTAPPPPSTASAVDPDAAVLAEYEGLKGKAPIRANAFRMLNGAAIARAEARRAS